MSSMKLGGLQKRLLLGHPVDEDRIVEVKAYVDGGLVGELFRTTES